MKRFHIKLLEFAHESECQNIQMVSLLLENDTSMSGQKFKLLWFVSTQQFLERSTYMLTTSHDVFFFLCKFVSPADGYDRDKFQ